MSTINVREDFRRDGLAANFLVTPTTIGLLSQSIPSSKINIGYPGICPAEYAACENILNSNPNSPAELCVTGHARADHLDVLSGLVKNRSHVSANVWIPTSDYFINNTFKQEPYKVLEGTESLVERWYKTSNKPLDIALTDITADESRIVSRVEDWTRRLLDKGVRKIILCDTRGIGNPVDMDKLFSQVSKYADSLEFHPHNDRGYALQNIQKAISHGIKTIGTAIYSAGERKTMIDPMLLIGSGLDIRLDKYKSFIQSYKQDLGDPETIVDYIFGNGLIITGTQYRLRNRDNSLKPMFGVTSDRYILGRMLGVERDSITELQLEQIKDELLYNQRHIVVDGKKIKDYLDSLDNKNLRGTRLGNPYEK